MVCIFSRGMLGVSALVIAAGCASAPSQPQTRGGTPTRSADLQGRSSGVLIQNMASGGIRVVLASGPTSLGSTTYTPSNGTDRAPAQPQNVTLGSSEPLFLLNGVPYNPGPGGQLVGINPDDIESIKALKDPADLALYGMRGGNGVIVITMKQRPKD
jgi:TonB-dependent SusC/RagA subfamily outer membrane receptor